MEKRRLSSGSLIAAGVDTFGMDWAIATLGAELGVTGVSTTVAPRSSITTPRDARPLLEGSKMRMEIGWFFPCLRTLIINRN